MRDSEKIKKFLKQYKGDTISDYKIYSNPKGETLLLNIEDVNGEKYYAGIVPIGDIKEIYLVFAMNDDGSNLHADVADSFETAEWLLLSDDLYLKKFEDLIVWSQKMPNISTSVNEDSELVISEKFEKLINNISTLLSASSSTKNIKVKNPGILEIPEGKHFWQMPLKHYIDLAKKKGRAAVMRALLNLFRWNKNKNPDISKKAKDIIDRLKNSPQWQALAKADNEIDPEYWDIAIASEIALDSEGFEL